ncbi:hypothetical protein MRY87_12720 [bacterium]|nr:hypothetical protein [bacterium]
MNQIPTDHILTIEHILSDGAIAKRITCRSGRIAVFRANAPEKLYELELALKGEATEESPCYRITLNGAPFSPEEHLFIGFNGVRPTLPSRSLTVAEHLESIGVPAADLPLLLKNHGLFDVRDVPLEELAAPEYHGVILLTASRERHPVLVLNDPFLLIPEPYREQYAETLANGVWRMKAVGLVVSLSWRPNHWIDNDLITRVQIDQTTRRATVGIGAVNPLTELARQLRREKKAVAERQREQAEEERRKSSPVEVLKAQLPEPPSWAPSRSSWKRISALLLLLISLWFIFGDVVTAALRRAALHFVSQQDTPSSLSQPENQDPQMPEGTPLLTLYPSDIRDGVLAAFYDDLQSSKRVTNRQEEHSRTTNSGALPTEERQSTIPRRTRPPSSNIPQRTATLPPAFSDRMDQMTSGKDPAVRERIEMMMQRLRERGSLRETP